MDDVKVGGLDVLANARKLGWVIPDWPAPDNVRAVCTTRQGGVSAAPFDALNVGDHVGDDPVSVAQNRRQVREVLQLPAEPLWLEQVHGTDVVSDFPSGVTTVTPPKADASAIFNPHQVSVTMTADCLPVLFCDRQGTRVASAHAGWRGLCNGVLEATIKSLDCDPADLMAWLGPAIGPDAFEVGAEVREAFMAHDSQAVNAFVPSVQNGKYLANIYELARQRLSAAGMPISQVYGGEYCTVSDSARFFSYRRTAKTGRMASLIWMR